MRKDIEGLEFRYEGDRFEGGRLPVVMLSDLQAFRELVLAYAKEEWRSRNPTAKSLGKSFEDKVGLDLLSITNKCALLKLETTLDKSDGALDLTDEEIITSASKDVRELYAEANKGIFPKSLHTKKYEQVKIFGKHLKEGEFVVIGANDNGDPIYVDVKSRKGILDNASEIKEERIYGKGHLFGAQIDGKIVIDTPDHGRLRIKIPGDFKVEVVKGGSNVVCYDLKAKLTEDRRIKDTPEVVMVDIMTTEQLDAFDASMRAIRSVENASRISRESARRILDQRPLYAHNFIASSNGDEGILFEFVNNGWMWSIEMNSCGSCEIYGVEIEGASEVNPVEFQNVDDAFIDLIDEKIGGDIV